jgi:hypothetical protein
MMVSRDRENRSIAALQLMGWDGRPRKPEEIIVTQGRKRSEGGALGRARHTRSR